MKLSELEAQLAAIKEVYAEVYDDLHIFVAYMDGENPTTPTPLVSGLSAPPVTLDNCGWQGIILAAAKWPDPVMDERLKQALMYLNPKEMRVVELEDSDDKKI